MNRVVWLVKVTGVQDVQRLRRLVQRRYPQSDMVVYSDHIGYIWLPQPYWRMTGYGDEGFFSDLYQQGLIQSYERVYSTN